MLTEKLEKKIKTINEEFIKLGFDLESDILDLCQEREDIAERLENTKFKKITFAKDEEENCYILNLEDCQIGFFVLFGEDEEGPWYEVEAEIIFF